MKKGKRLSKAEIKRRLLAELEITLRDGFGLSSVDASQLLKSMLTRKGNPASDSLNAKYLKAAVSVVWGESVRIRILGTKIRTGKQLEAALREIREAREKMPTVTRKALKMFSNMLPRRGGPGRQPKLNAKEASSACDHIAAFIRQGNSLKEALRKMAETSLSVLGKKVGARTLQKAWDSRKKPISE